METTSRQNNCPALTAATVRSRDSPITHPHRWRPTPVRHSGAKSLLRTPLERGSRFMKTMKRYWLGLALAAALTPRLLAQVPPAPGAAALGPPAVPVASPLGAPAAAPAAPAGGGGLWSFLCP